MIKKVTERGKEKIGIVRRGKTIRFLPGVYSWGSTGTKNVKENKNNKCMSRY